MTIRRIRFMTLFESKSINNEDGGGGDMFLIARHDKGKNSIYPFVNKNNGFNDDDGGGDAGGSGRRLRWWCY